MELWNYGLWNECSLQNSFGYWKQEANSIRYRRAFVPYSTKQDSLALLHKDVTGTAKRKHAQAVVALDIKMAFSSLPIGQSYREPWTRK